MADGFINPWWETHYGIDDADEFLAVTAPLWEETFFFDPTGSLRGVAEGAALVSPSGAPGLLAAAYLTKIGYDGTEGTPFLQSLVDSLESAYQLGIPEESSMVSLLIPDCFQVNIDATSGGQPITNVVGVENAGGTAAGAAAAVQTAWKIATGPLSQLSNFYALVQFKAVDIGDPNGDIVVVPDTTAGGAGAAALATNAASSLVKWNGGTRSRSSRGRLYFGPLSETNINSDGRTLTSGARTAQNTAFSVFRGSLTAAGYPLVVLSRKLSEAFVVTTSDVETVIATQRRRIRN